MIIFFLFGIVISGWQAVVVLGREESGKDEACFLVHVVSHLAVLIEILNFML